MNTHSHAVCTWALARHLQADPAAAACGAAGASLPDLPYLAKGALLIARERRGLTRQRLMEELDYFDEPSWGVDLALHSLLPVGTLLALGSLRRRERAGRLRWFLLGWAGHNLVDLATHGGDARPHLWPAWGWRWQSPVSYWDRDRHAIPLLIGEHALLVGLGLVALRRSRAERRVH